jgi:ADP-heptose:LPS heptosyltransferase
VALAPAAERPTLLVLRALGLGDLLAAVPALRALAAAFEEYRRLLAVPPALAPLAALIREAGGRPCFAPVPAAPLGPLPPAALRPDVAVNLHGSGPQSHAVLRAVRPQRLIAFAHPAIDAHRGPAWSEDEHEARRWCRLLQESGISADPRRLEISRPPRARPAPPQAAGATLLHPGAASAARRWPAPGWVAVARAERARGRTVLLTGGPQERGLALGIARAAGIPPSAVLAGRTDVLDLAAVVAAAGRLVCNDTGVAHLATALGTPSVILFGPTSPAQWGPPPVARHRVLWAGRTGDPHGDRCDPGLRAITPEQVVVELRALETMSA